MNVRGINVRTQRQGRRFQRILEAGKSFPGSWATGLDRSCMSGNGDAVAIGAGTVSTDEPLARHVHMKGRAANAERAMSPEGRILDEPKTATCAPTQARPRMIQTVMTARVNVHGLPMMRLLPITASGVGNEKDRCANTGLLRQRSLDVSFGIRSDNRQTA